MDEQINNNFDDKEGEGQNTMEVPVVESAAESAISDAPAGGDDGFTHSLDKRGRFWLPIYITSMLVIITCATVLASYMIPLLKQDGMFKGMAKIITPIMGNTEPPAKTNVLLVGTDRGGYRTDTMMIASYDNSTGQVHVMQIPRDTYVGNNGRRDKKVNSAYFTGIDQLKHEIELSYGIKIQKYLAVELDGFVQMVDKLGGVEIDVPVNMNYDDPEQNLHIHLNKGFQHLDGSKSEQFVRFRKNNDGTGYPMGDIGRMEAQKNFIEALVQKTVSMDGLSRISELIGIAQQNIKTDILYDEAYSYVSTLLTMDREKVIFVEAPGEMEYKYKGWYFFVDAKKAKEVSVQFFNGDGNVQVSATALPAATPRAEAGHSAVSDVSDEERYSYYTKTPAPKKTHEPTREDEDDAETSATKSPEKPSPTPNQAGSGTPKPSSAVKETAAPAVKPTPEAETTPKPAATQAPNPVGTPAGED